MTNLAIKGHPTRGREVIEILEMLGGKQFVSYSGVALNWCYTIINGSIEWDYLLDKYKVFSLEEFLEKFPYKVGDRVKTVYGSCGKVYEMKWIDDEIQYRLNFGHHTSGWYVVNELQPYKEETMKTITIDDFKANTKEWLIDKLHGMVISDAIKTIGNIHDELHKPKYPKTYEECCRIVNADPYIRLKYDLSDGQKYSYDVDNLHLYENLRQLLICRDAYWKIAGEQMGLGKPWKPDWSLQDTKYIIVNRAGVLRLNEVDHYSRVLAFPTREMRDAFYENFKELIEKCKELL